MPVSAELTSGHTSNQVLTNPVVELLAPSAPRDRQTTDDWGDRISVTRLTVHVRQVALPTGPECDASLGPSAYVQAEQRKDPNLQLLLAWLDKGSVPDEGLLKLASAEKRSYWVFREFFFLANNILYRKGEDDRDRVVVPVSLREEVLQLGHDVASAAHQGTARTKERIKHSFYWYRMSRDIKNYVLGCTPCNKSKAANRKNKFPLTQNHAGLPLEKVHIDFVGPLPVSAKGNQHILVIVDQFTKWLEIVPLPSQRAEVTARAVVDHFFARFGAAAQIVTDQGTNFEAGLFKQVCQILGIHKSRTTAWRPSANGQVERHNRTIKNAIRCYVSDHQRDWDVNLPLIASAIRASVNRSTGYTPNRLMLGREVDLPADIVFPAHPKTLKDHDEFVSLLQKGLHDAHECARRTLQTQLKKSKDFYDAGAKVVQFAKGDAVYYLDMNRRNKLSPVWIGPCLVVHQSSPYNFDILIRNDLKKRVNHDLIKVCTDRTLPQWLKNRKVALLEGVEATFCYCERPDDFRVMVQCGQCYNWFHHHCLGLTQSQAKQLGDWRCRGCG